MVSRATAADLHAFAQGGSLRVGRQPYIEMLSAPRRIQLGEVLTVRWATVRASMAELELVTPIGNELRSVPHRGEISLQPQLAGAYQATLRLRNDDAPDLPLVIDSKFTEVMAPRVRVQLTAKILEGRPGAFVRLHWRAPGAYEVELRREISGELEVARSCGWIDAFVDWVVSDVTVRAMDRNGRTLGEASCTIKPLVAMNQPIDAELGLLHQPLQEWT